MKFQREAFIALGCELSRYMHGPGNLYDLTNGDPCEGCATSKSCSIKIRLKNRPANMDNAALPEYFRLTNKEIAEILQITTRQVSKLRKAGKLDGEWELAHKNSSHPGYVKWKNRIAINAK